MSEAFYYGSFLAPATAIAIVNVVVPETESGTDVRARIQVMITNNILEPATRSHDSTLSQIWFALEEIRQKQNIILQLLVERD